MPAVTFALPGGAVRRVAIPAGVTLLEAARRAGVALEGACGGAMACATCHVHVEPDWAARLPPASPEERDMLDLARDLAVTSRLACQLRPGEAEDGLAVRVPASSLLEPVR